MKKITNTSNQSKNKKLSKYVPTLLKHKSEADIFKCHNLSKVKKPDFVSEIHWFQDSKQPVESKQQEKAKKGTLCKAVNFKAYIK